MSAFGRAVRRAGPLLTLLAVALARPGAAAEPVLAVGDIHGELGGFTAILEEAGWIDEGRRWAGGRATLVQTGDFLDRGPEVAAVMDLLIDLQEQAAAAGGRAVVLLGNHEAMNLAAVYRDVGPEAYSRFVTEESEKRRREAFKQLKRFLQRLARERGGLVRFDKDAWMAAHPPGLLEYRESLRPEGRYGKWVRTLPTVARVDDTLFIHGGLAPEVAGSSLEAINRQVREEIERFDRERQQLLDDGVILPFFDLGQILAYLREAVAARTPAEGEAAPADPQLARWRESLAWLESMIVDSNLFREHGPLWFRGWTLWSDAELETYLPAALEGWGVRRVVAAHTPSIGEIQARWGRRIFLIDTGMLASFYPGGRASALELRDGAITALYPNERVVLEPAAATAVATVASLSPAAATLAAQAGPPESGAPPAPAARVLLGPDDRPLPFGSDEEILDFLRTARVVESEEVGEGVTRPRRLLLERGGIRARAIFHDVDLQRDHARLGQAFVKDFRDRWANQVAAYEVARMLGLDNVPPTVAREVQGVPGSVALWIEKAMTEGDRIEREIAPADPTSWRRRFYDMRVFDSVIGNIDRNAGNILYDSTGWLWLIDHTRAFGRSSDPPALGKVVACSRGLKAALERLDLETAMPRLEPYLSKFEVKSMLKRRDRVLEHLARQVAERGERSVLFDYAPLTPENR